MVASLVEQHRNLGTNECTHISLIPHVFECRLVGCFGREAMGLVVAAALVRLEGCEFGLVLPLKHCRALVAKVFHVWS